MPNCKFCDKPVKAANVFHSACWETQVEKVAEDFCDNCALIKVLNLGL